MKIEVLGMQDMDDGSALMTVDMDREMLITMAKTGLLKVLTDAAAKDIATELEVAEAENIFLKQVAKDLEELSVHTYNIRERYRQGEVFQEHIKEATRQMNVHLTWAITNNMNIVLDQTNLTKNSRRGKLSIIPKHYRKIAVVVPVPEQEEWRRRLDRPGKIIPQNVIDNMLNMYEEPSLNEGFDDIVIQKTY